MTIEHSDNRPIPKWCTLPPTIECWNIIAGHAIRQGRKCCRNCDYIDPPYQGANAYHGTIRKSAKAETPA